VFGSCFHPVVPLKIAFVHSIRVVQAYTQTTQAVSKHPCTCMPIRRRSSVTPCARLLLTLV
jgi:hypothetical protein